MSGARLNMSELIATCSVPVCHYATLPLRAGQQQQQQQQCSCHTMWHIAAAAAAAAAASIAVDICPCPCGGPLACACLHQQQQQQQQRRKRAAEILTGNVANNIFNTPSLTNCTHAHIQTHSRRGNNCFPCAAISSLESQLIEYEICQLPAMQSKQQQQQQLVGYLPA